MYKEEEGASKALLFGKLRTFRLRLMPHLYFSMDSSYCAEVSFLSVEKDYSSSDL